MSVQLTLTDRQYLLARDAIHREACEATPERAAELGGLLRSVDSQGQAQEAIGSAMADVRDQLRGGKQS